MDFEDFFLDFANFCGCGEILRILRDLADSGLWFGQKILRRLRQKLFFGTFMQNFADFTNLADFAEFYEIW